MEQSLFDIDTVCWLFPQCELRLAKDLNLTTQGLGYKITTGQSLDNGHTPKKCVLLTISKICHPILC